MARPTKLTADVFAAIVAAKASGATNGAAADAVGVRRETLQEWRRKRADLARAMDDAHAAYQREQVRRIVSRAH
jgi:hypothetical protein